MSDPFKILEPTVISFSGGRTSAYMLWRVLQSNGGKLPKDAIVCFANTGKEMEETLEFVRDCETNWNVPIVWLEYTTHKTPKKRFKVVNFETASRDGEPFAMSIDQNGKPYLPNPVARICTINLKIRVIDHYCKSIGWKHNENMDWVGIRADEPRRAAKIGINRTPLVSDNISAEDIGEFWKNNSFDLKLSNFKGKTMHGNCDLCFLKPAHQIQSLIQEKPSRADWWIKMENHVESHKAEDDTKTLGLFRKDRPSYKKMKQYAIDQADLFDQDEPSIDCFCGD
jgi:3'-phosphoadenosine 5'-phosphosulfate sulfotransferase (PAPS reductase)/FAD synthetase